jgi:hypothetical protein
MPHMYMNRMVIIAVEEEPKSILFKTVGMNVNSFANDSQ